MCFWQDEAPANAVHDICIWYMIKCQHVRWNTTDLLYGMDSSKKMFNSGRIKYWLRIISWERTFHFLCVRSHLKELSQVVAVGHSVKEQNKEIENIKNLDLSVMLNNITHLDWTIWQEHWKKKEIIYEPKCKNKVNYFSLIAVLNSQAPEEVRIGLAGSKYQKSWHNDIFCLTTHPFFWSLLVQFLPVFPWND